MFSASFLWFIVLPYTATALNIRQSPQGPVACNNSPDLCSKSYSGITYLGAHDSPFVRDASTGFSTAGNHYYNTTVQLDAGVRLLSAQVHDKDGALHLCHSSCSLLDAGNLTDWLTSIRVWMDSNPNEVVTVLLVNSDNKKVETIAQSFTASNIAKYAYVPPPTNGTYGNTTWPTLQTMISSNKRLVTFVTNIDRHSPFPYLLNEFDFIFETPFDNTSIQNFTCHPDRPSTVSSSIKSALAGNRLPLMNHFLDAKEAFGIEVPDVDNVNTTNSASTSTVGALGHVITTCTTAYENRPPTFVLVDFFDQGPAIEAVDAINGVSATVVGRKKVPEKGGKSFSSAVSGLKPRPTAALGIGALAGLVARYAF